MYQVYLLCSVTHMSRQHFCLPLCLETGILQQCGFLPYFPILSRLFLNGAILFIIAQQPFNR